MNSPVPGSSSRSIFVAAALFVAIFAAAGLAIVHLHRQMHQVARQRVDLERSLSRVESSILDCRGRIEQARSAAVAEERRSEPLARGLSPVRPDRVARIPAARADGAVAFAPADVPIPGSR